MCSSFKADKELCRETAIYLPDAFQIEFNYNQTLKNKIKKAKFAHIDKGIKDDLFLPGGRGKKIKITKLFNFSPENDDYLNLAKPATKIMEAGYRPANIFELCDIAISNPFLQLYFPIVALGSMREEGNFIIFPALDSCTHSIKRQLTSFLFWTEGNVVWPKYCRFLAVA
jgi:hypothetical protein